MSRRGGNCVGFLFGSNNPEVDTNAFVQIGMCWYPK